MKLLEVFRFEIAYQVRRVWPWLAFAVLAVVCFLTTRNAAVADAMYEDFFINGPFSIALTTVIGGILWLLVAPVVAGDAGARDVATGMHPLTWSAPIRKTEYLAGRFLAALVLNALLLLAVQAGILVAVYSPGVNPAVIGPFQPAAHLTAYAFIALPNAFVAAAIQFFLALRSGRPLAGYLGSLFLIFMGFFVASILLFQRGLGTLLDPIGIRFIVEDLAHLWTPIERNTRLLGLEGFVLTNRLLWTGVGAGALAVTWLSFRFAHRAAGKRGWRRAARSQVVRAPTPAVVGVTASGPMSVPRVPLTLGIRMHARQVFAIARDSFRTLAKSWAGLALLVAVPMMAVLVVLDQTASLGVPLIPATALVLRELTGGMSAELAAEPSRWVIVPLFIVFFAGELVWRERDAGLGELTDAMPGSEWAPFLGKLLGLGIVLALFMLLLGVAGMAAQGIAGHDDLEIGLYLKVLLGLQLPEYFLFAVLALLVHVLVHQKYVGHLAAVMVYAFIALLAPVLGIEHNLLVYGDGPAWSYTEIRGFGSSLGPWLWFKLYWVAWALLLAVAVRLLWMRGKERNLRIRFQAARHRLTRPTAVITVAALGLVVALGGFVFYNTNVLHEYLSTSDVEEMRAEYERRYRRYENVPQPRLAEADLRVEIYPNRGAVDINGSYRLVNGGPEPIDSIHVATAANGVMTLDRTAALVVDDADHAYRIYALRDPLRPGDTLRLDFQVDVRRRGFGNRGVDPWVVANGTYFTSLAWFPVVGYQRSRELMTPNGRREHGLEPRPVLASLYETEGREPTARGGGIMFEAVVGTDEDQVAVAPGALRRTWTENGRRWFHYTTDAPIGTEWAFFSADYAVHEGRWNDVAIQILHHPEHTAHLERMMRSVRASLDYAAEHFGPYPYRHLGIVEHPAALGTGAHADASLISYGQGFAFWLPPDEQSLDLPFFVMAHEMGHQWTVPYALVEGLPFLAEGLATFFAMQVVKETRGDAQFRRLLAFMRQPYPYRPIRRGEPLLRALDPYLSRRKGPFVMHALSDYVGSDRVNSAIRHLIQTHDSPGAPPATTLDLYRELEAVTPDSLQSLLHDLFEVNTYWQLATERVTAEQTVGDWRVTLDVRARKVVLDSTGVEIEVPMDEWIDVGVFAHAADGDELNAPVYVRKHRIRSGRQTITVTVPREPILAGIDPYHVLDWEERDNDDNIEGVATVTGDAASGRSGR